MGLDIRDRDCGLRLGGWKLGIENFGLGIRIEIGIGVGMEIRDRDWGLGLKLGL